MRKTSLLFIITLCLVVETFAQGPAVIRRKAIGKPCHRGQYIEGQLLQLSAEDINLRVITRHPDSGVLVGGSVYLQNRQGLILHSHGEQLNAVLVPKVTDIEDLTFTTREIGWRLYAGVLYVTNSGGACWRRVFKHKKLNSIYFTDIQHGWLAGRGGIIYHTNDGGRSWHRQNSGTDFNLGKIFFFDPLHGWAIGKKAYGDYPPKWKTALIATRDGGQTWQQLITDKVLSLEAFSFINNSEGWGIDSNSNIVHTLDGGRTWILQRAADEKLWTSVFFVNEREGWVVGDGILHTDDGGVSWMNQLQGGQHGLIEAVLFADREHGWALRSQQLLHTQDGGLSWKSIFQDRRIAVSEK